MNRDLEIRDWIATDYQSNARRLGGEVSFEEAQRIAASDMAITDAVERGENPHPAPPAAREEPKIRQRTAENALDEGVAIERRVIPAREFPRPTAMQLGPNGWFLNRRRLQAEKQMKLLQRMMALCATEKKPDGSSVPLYPTYRDSFLGEHFDWQVGRGKYEGKNKQDRDAIFVRFMEDAADRSTAFMGGWWVKK